MCPKTSSTWASNPWNLFASADKFFIVQYGASLVHNLYTLHLVRCNYGVDSCSLSLMKFKNLIVVDR
jgi:hypothetical protein